MTTDNDFVSGRHINKYARRLHCLHTTNPDVFALSIIDRLCFVTVVYCCYFFSVSKKIERTRRFITITTWKGTHNNRAHVDSSVVKAKLKLSWWINSQKKTTNTLGYERVLIQSHDKQKNYKRLEWPSD